MGVVLALVNNSGINIHFQSFGSGPPLVLVHGFTQDSRLWEDLGYVEALKSSFQVITIDVRGHGSSDRPDDPSAYTLNALVSDFIAVLDDLGIKAAHYLGYSMGGRIGTAIALRKPERLLSATLVGTSFFDTGYHAFVDVAKNDAEGFADALTVLTGEPCDRAYRWLLRATGVQSYLALGKQAEMESNLGFDLPDLPISCVVGDLDQRAANVKRMHLELEGSQFFELSGENHESSIRRVEEVTEIVRKQLSPE